MKKILVLILACCALSACGDDNDKCTIDELDIQNEDQTGAKKTYTIDDEDFDPDSASVLDWDGDCILIKHCDGEEKWYFEPIDIANHKHGVIHSKFSCRAVRYGVVPNICLPEFKFRHSFCTQCMNEALIEKWYEWFKKGESRKSNINFLKILLEEPDPNNF